MLGMLGIIPIILSIPMYYLAGRYSTHKQKEELKEGKTTQSIIRKNTLLLNNVASRVALMDKNFN